MKYKISLLIFSAFFISIFSCENNTPQKETSAPQKDNSVYLKKGKTIAKSTFVALSGKLQSAMKEGGVPNAIKYCNLAAFPLVDSLSKVHHADIRRTSLKYRNPKDAPTAEEKTILEEYAKTAATGGKLKPIIKEINEQTLAFYAPIKINGMCLQCHGKIGESLTAENYAHIQKYYPEDKAVGYSDGELRGMWSIRFEK